MRFTEEQTEAIRRREGSLLLEANAGSGKTSVLVERFVRSVLDDDIVPARILAITFTDKAAGELRSRVRARFLELGERDWARETETAWVSTVHGFCARVLRAHAIAAGLDPAFTVLDEATARDPRDAAWDDALGRFLDGEHGAEALELAAAYGADRLRTAVVGAHDALRSAGQTRPRLPDPGPLDDPHALRAPLAAARAEAAVALAGAGDGGQVVRAREVLDACGELLDGLGEGALPPAGRLAELKFSGTARALKSEPCGRYLAAHAAYATACRDHHAARAVALLDELLGHYADAYAAAKRDRGALDFDDLELRTRDLFAAEPALRRSYAERFDRVMVDEFQDSNPLQLELFAALDRDDVFLVGDEQQSIYGFRHADVEVFRRRRAELGARGRVASLATNFRSRGEILDTLNATFEPRFAPHFVPLREGRDPRPAGEPLVELLVTDRAGWEESGHELGDLPRAATWRHAEARLLAQRIADLVGAGDARPEDVVVLVRGMGDLPVYERALEDQGLLTLAVGGRGYWGRQVVRDLCAWLAALANPRDEAALYGVLASPLVGASSDALALVARAGTGNAWRAIEEGGALLERQASGDRERLETFRTRFAAERAQAPRLALDELLRRVVEQTGYDLHVLALPGGSRRLANVHKLLRLAAEFERDHGRDVRGLVDRATAELEAEAREPDAPVELGDVKAVRLMSIHAAKGLEFGVVCVADLGRRGGSDDAVDLLVGDGEVGLRLVGMDASKENTLAFERLRDLARQRAQDEEERILYVALTRARERLILSGAVTVDRWPGEGHAAPPINWLAPALLGGDLAGMPTTEEPVRDVAWSLNGFPARVRCALNRPATVGRVLREASLAPAGTSLPVTPPPPPAPPAPEAPAAPPVVRTLSYSALSDWSACGYRFYLRRVLGLPEEAVDLAHAGPDPSHPEGALDLRVRGSIVHALLEEDEPAAPAERAAELALSFGIELTAEQGTDVARLVAAFERSPLHARLAAATSVRREHAFAFTLEATLLTGVVDVLAEEAGGARLVVDYKTDGVEPGADLETYVAEHYAIQRRVYALAVLRGGAERVEVAYAFLERPGEPVAATFAAADAGRLEEELRALAAGPLGGAYPVTDRPHRDLCLTCPGRRALCSHPEEMTLRASPDEPARAAAGGA